MLPSSAVLVQSTRRRRSSQQRSQQTAGRPGEQSVQRGGRQQRLLALKRSSWQCRLETGWQRLPDDTFPRFLETGRCIGSRTCLLGLYECTARRYTVKLLRRHSRQHTSNSSSSSSCLPVPTVSLNSTYEDVWSTVEYQVTVGCECSRRRQIGRHVMTSHKDNAHLLQDNDAIDDVTEGASSNDDNSKNDDVTVAR